jgi:hypothetical protein
MIVYIDSSVVLRALLGQPNKLKTWGQWQDSLLKRIAGRGVSPRDRSTAAGRALR